MHKSKWALAPVLGAMALMVPAFQSSSTELSGVTSSGSAPLVLAQAGKDAAPGGGRGGGPAAGSSGGGGPSMGSAPSTRGPSAGSAPSGPRFSGERGGRSAERGTITRDRGVRTEGRVRDRDRPDVTVRSRDSAGSTRTRDRGDVTVRNRDRGDVTVERRSRTRVDRTGRFEGDRPWRRGARHVWGPGLVFYFYDGHYYGDCGWLRRRAEETGSSYWWHRYRLCRSGE